MGRSRRVIIDTDPGKDDAVAILLALASPELEVMALVAVAGNVPLNRTAGNASRLVRLAGRETPVFAGCAGPLKRVLVDAAEVHGATGLAGLDLTDGAAVQARHGVDYLIDTLRAEPSGSVTLCLLGPATNLAVALIKAPDIAGRIAEVVWMAGAGRAGGNVTPVAEYNVYADPDAAEIVLGAGMPLTLVPLDLTHQIRLTPERLGRLRAIPSVAARAVVALFETDRDPPLHDPCVIAHLLRPLFTGARVNVQVETASALTLGMTVADVRGVTGRAPNAVWLDRGDAAGFFALLEERLA